jgi:hypothetical protein
MLRINYFKKTFKIKYHVQSNKFDEIKNIIFYKRNFF